MIFNMEAIIGDRQGGINAVNKLSSSCHSATLPRGFGAGDLPETGVFLEREQSPEPARLYHKAAVLNRFVAKSLDVLIVLGVEEMAPPYGFWAALWYILLADGFSGRSIGKRVIGLQTWVSELHTSAGFKESIIRNLPIAAAFLAWQVPYIGWLGAMAILGIEALLIIGNDRGLRIGDELAHTQVVTDSIFDVDPQA
jgi:hypothetical protein